MSQDTYPLSLHAARAARHALDEYLGVFEVALLDDLKIITSELVSNAVLHSGRPEGDPILVTTSLASDVMRVDVVDQGTGQTPLHPRSSGVKSGLEIVRQISDRWSGTTSAPHVWAEIDVVVDGLVKRRDARIPALP